MTVSMVYTNRYILESSTTSFCIGKPVSKDIENIKERIAGFKVFKEEFGKNETIFTVIRNEILLWKDKLETAIENNGKTSSIEKSYY